MKQRLPVKLPVATLSILLLIVGTLAGRVYGSRHVLSISFPDLWASSQVWHGGRMARELLSLELDS